MHFLRLSCKILANFARLLTYFIFIDVGTDMKGRLVEWVEKVSFNRLNRLFEIAAGERNYQTLFSTRNLLVAVRETHPYTLNITPRRLPKKVVAGERFVLKNLYFYVEACKADAQARQECLNQREEKRQEGTLRRAPGEKRLASFPPARSSTEKKRKIPIKGIIIRSPTPSSSSASTSESRPPRRVPGANGSGPSVPAHERLAHPAEEESAVDQPRPFHFEPKDLPLVVVDQPTAMGPGLSFSDLVPFAPIVMEKLDAERSGSSGHEPKSLAIVVSDESAAKRPTPPCDL